MGDMLVFSDMANDSSPMTCPPMTCPPDPVWCIIHRPGWDLLSPMIQPGCTQLSPWFRLSFVIFEQILKLLLINSN